MKCLILAGGLGTRISDIAKDLPKALLPIRGVPFIAYQLSWLKKSGISSVVLSIGHLAEKIQNYVGDGSRWGLSVTTVVEKDKLLGTGGAVRYAVEQGAIAKDPWFFVQYGDSFLPAHYEVIAKVYEQSDLPVLMTVFANSGKWDTSNVVFKDGKIVVYDKTRQHPLSKEMAYIDYGLSIFTQDIVLKRIEPGVKVDLGDPLRQLSLDGKLLGLEIQKNIGERFYEVGSKTGIEDFEAWVDSNKGDLKWLIH